MKKIACIVSAVMLLVIFVGCGGQVTPSSDRQRTTQQQVKTSLPVATDAPVVVTEPETEPVKPVEEEDPIGIYRCTDENKDGIFLKRGDKYYFTVAEIKRQAGVKYDVGVLDGGSVYWADFIDCNADSQEWFYDSVPIVELQPSDEFIVFSGSEVPQLRIMPVNSINYTVMSWGEDFSALNHFEMKNSDGDIISSEEWHSLKDGEVYTVSWYEGTQYHEEQRIANKKFVVMPSSGSIKVEAELTKEGYGVYRLPTLEPGLYRFNLMLVLVP